MRKRITLLLAVAALLFGAWGFYRLTVTASRGGQSTPLYSIRRFDPYGAAALHRLLSERLEQVGTLERPRLPADLQGALVQILPLPDDEQPEGYRLPTASLLAWVAEGNTLIQLTRGATDVMAEAGIAFAHADALPSAAESIEDHQQTGKPPAAVPGTLVRPTWTHAAARFGQLPPLVLREPRSLHSNAAGWQPLAEFHGRTVAGELAHGTGRIIIVGAPTVALNETLGEGGNLGFLLAAVGEEAVTFDEWSHGVGATGSMMELIRQFGLLPMLGQFLLVAWMYRWSTRGQGIASPPSTPRRRSSREQIQILGHLYQRALDEQDRVCRVYEEVLGRFAGVLRCRPEHVDARLTSVKTDAAQRARHLLAELRAIIRRYQPRCRGCGYNLTGVASDRCSECGERISRPIRRQIEAQQRSNAQAAAAPAGRWRDADLARILTVSHQLMKDLQRD